MLLDKHTVRRKHGAGEWRETVVKVVDTVIFFARYTCTHTQRYSHSQTHVHRIEQTHSFVCGPYLSNLHSLFNTISFIASMQ